MSGACLFGHASARLLRGWGRQQIQWGMDTRSTAPPVLSIAESAQPFVESLHLASLLDQLVTYLTEHRTSQSPPVEIAVELEEPVWGEGFDERPAILVILVFDSNPKTAYAAWYALHPGLAAIAEEAEQAGILTLTLSTVEERATV